MVAIKTALHRWQREILLVTRNPRLLFTIVVIGFFMLWFANEQVRTTLGFLVRVKLAEPRSADKLLERYFLVGLFIMGFVWLDLVLLNSLVAYVSQLLKALGNYLWNPNPHEAEGKHGGLASETNPRKNPVRACRGNKYFSTWKIR